MSLVSAAPRLAATVVPLRDAPTGSLEVLLCRRSADVRAASGAMVFPGGTLDEADVRLAQLVDENVRQAFSRALGTPEGLVFALAASREMTEEVGFAPLGLRPYRERVARGEVDWIDAARESGSFWDLEALEYLAHWITPLERPHRFDTRFFLSECGDQVPEPDGHEIVDAAWVSPALALEQFTNGHWTMLTPTVAVLRWLEGFSSCQFALEAARRRTVTTIQPRVVVRDGREVVEVPEPGL